MNISYACPHCSAPQRTEIDDDVRRLTCSSCGRSTTTPADALQGDRLQRCLVCPSHDLFMRKDFPQRVGVALVVVGIAGSSIAWAYNNLWWTFGILFSTALIDVVLYLLVGNALMCYRCGAHYRGVAEMESHGAFDLETHEKYRQLAARMPSP